MAIAAASPNEFLRVVIASSLEIAYCVELGVGVMGSLPARNQSCIWFQQPVRCIEACTPKQPSSR
jgi:hypothetical protein